MIVRCGISCLRIFSYWIRNGVENGGNFYIYSVIMYYLFFNMIWEKKWYNFEKKKFGDIIIS